MQIARLSRRDVVALVGGAAAAWPLAARAEQTARVRRIAFLHAFAENDPEVLSRVVAFRHGLEALGWTRTATSASSIAMPAEM